MTKKIISWNHVSVLLVAMIIILSEPLMSKATKVDFPQSQIGLSKEVETYLNSISSAQWKEFVDSGVNSVERQKRLETNLLGSKITVQNGSLSHAQLLDTLPNQESQRDSDIALKILKSSLFAYNTKCVPRGINGEECRTYLETKSLPAGTELRSECSKVLQNKRDGHHAFRRLLARRYKDTFHEMFDDNQLPRPWNISTALNKPEAASSNANRTKFFEDDRQNLVLVQWSQFIEHDLSKPVATSMSNGFPIECCNRHQNKLQPRYHHPACAPILSKGSSNGWQTCLNYVRSALAVGNECNFGAAEQLNQATGSLDLSQLYGFTRGAEHKMRTLRNGNLRSTSTASHMNDLLPMTTDAEGHTFCVRDTGGNASACFAAGDSRVNNNPYSILIYTIFMRNHNRIAAELLSQHPSWTDEQLFQASKTINIDIYRRTVMEEWLPEVLGTDQVEDVLSAPLDTALTDEVSNEFGVAAIRFYFSMLPNVLHYFPQGMNLNENEENNNGVVQTNLFVLKDELYTPQLQYTAKKLDDILQSLLHQRKMKMDASYVGALTWDTDEKNPTNADVLAFDIQRGRDHGLQPYYKYLEVCNNVKINDWRDYEHFISKENLDKLKNVYKSWADVDLIVGGIAERIVKGSVGSTFRCILSEEFSKIHQRHRQRQRQRNTALLQSYRTINGSKLLCLNSELKAVSQNIFRLPSPSNQLIYCDDVV